MVISPPPPSRTNPPLLPEATRNHGDCLSSPRESGVTAQWYSISVSDQVCGNLLFGSYYPSNVCIKWREVESLRLQKRSRIQLQTY